VPETTKGVPFSINHQMRKDRQEKAYSSQERIYG
jgi:hypothetical protein